MELSEAIQFIQCSPLLHAGISRWADLGSGSGLYARALSHYLPEGSTIYAVDKQLPARKIKGIQWLELDFVTDHLPFDPLDGILMANALHYVKDKPTFVQKTSGCLKPDGQFIVIEYDIERPVPVWVPYPLPFRALATLFPHKKIQKLGERPSVYGQGNMYAALIF